MPRTTLTFAQQQQAISSAAQAWSVPMGYLWGVYGLETDFGQNIATSSAGAVGAFQFLPSTARQFNYPLTNTPSYAQFWSQAQSAAKYLQQLFRQTGSWDAAFRSYSGGGYGAADVAAKSSSDESKKLAGNGWFPGLLASITGAAGLGALGGLAAGAGDAAATAAGAGEAAAAGGAGGSAIGYTAKGLSDLSTIAKAGGIAALLVDPHFMWRLVKLIAGLGLGYFALRELAAAGGVK